MNKGDGFLLRRSRDVDFHLHVVLVAPTQTAKGVAVSLTTNKTVSGECNLVKGDHPWITQECWVAYAYAIEIGLNPAGLQDLKFRGLFREERPFEPSVVERITAHAKVSPALEQRFKALL